jgi:hypothetical protein
MIPIGPLAAVVYALIRAAANRESTTKPANRTSTAAVKAQPNSGSEMPALLQILLVLLFIGILFALSHRWLGPSLILISIVILVLLQPWWITRNILVPLRFHRLAFYWMSVAAASWIPDKPNNCVLVAAWCLSRQRSPASSAIAWAERRLPKWRKLRGSTVATHAMLATARGQLHEARMLFGSVALFNPTVVSKPIARICFEWLAADSAARGDWVAVQHFSKHYRAPRIPTLILLNDLAKRPPGLRIPAAIEVWVARLGIRRADSLNSNQIFPHQNSANNRISADAGSLAAALGASMQTPRDAGQVAALAGHWQKALSDESLRQRRKLHVYLY